MKNQPNEMVRLEWLLPLFDQQLSIMSDGWQLDAHPDFELMAQYYHETSGALTMVDLPHLATLAAKLAQFAKTFSRETLDAEHSRLAQFAHQLLQYELTQYVQTGAYRIVLLDKVIQQLSRALVQKNVAVDDSVAPDSVAPSVDTLIDTEVSHSIEVVTPSHSALEVLQPEQYQLLLLAWRQQVQQLLAANSNLETVLVSLEKSSYYLWQTSTDVQQQRLWYLTALWLSNLANNALPLPSGYAQLLSRLDQVIENRHQQTSHTDEQSDKSIQKNDIEGLLAEIYIQLSILENIDEPARDILSHLSSAHDAKLHFLPRILAGLESVIFGLDEPKTLITPLQHIKKQLGRHGWIQYESQVSQVLLDLEDSMASDTVFAQMQWQIERQLQELYSAIYHTEQSIDLNIGHTVSLKPLSGSRDNQAVDAFSDDTLYKLRNAIKEVKQGFNSYIDGKQDYLSSSSAAFTDIGNILDDMGLGSVRAVSDKLAELFKSLETHEIQRLSKELVQALAQGVASIELLLDYLAQQVLDQQLLSQASEHLAQASTLVDAFIAAPDADIDVYYRTAAATSDVVRYDDSGEIAPDDSVKEKANADATGNIGEIAEAVRSTSDVSNTNSVESESLQAARRQVQPDNFEIDQEILEVFIEESTEIVEDLSDFVSIWQQDAQDLTPLTEVRRGYHSLKGAGRMVGAFSISEMAWSIESLLNRALDKTLPITEEMVMLVVKTTEQLPAMVASFIAKQAPTNDPAITILQSNNLAIGQPLNNGLDESATPDSAESMRLTEPQSKPTIAPDDSYEHMINDSIDELTAAPADKVIPAVLEPFMQQALQSPADDQDADPDIKEIFIEEATEVLADITPRYAHWRSNPSDLTELKEIRRGFHTLKGSGRMVGAHYTAELAWAVEDMLNRILDHSITVSTGIIELIDDILAAYPDLVSVFANNTSATNEEGESSDYPTSVPLWVACAHAYSKHHGAEFSYDALRKSVPAQDEQVITNADDAKAHSTMYCSDSVENPVNVSVSHDPALASIHSVNEMMADASAITTPQSNEEQEFCAIFIEEAQELLQDVKNFVNAHREDSEVEVADEIVRAFHTLRAASGSSALSAISEVSATIEQSLMQLQQQDTLMGSQHLQALCQSVLLIENYLNNYKQDVNQQDVPVETLQNQDDLACLQFMLGEPDEAETAINNELMVAKLLETNVDGLLDAEWQLEDELSNQDTNAIQNYVQQQIGQIERLAALTTASAKFTAILNALYLVYDHIAQNLEAAHETKVQTALLAGHKQLVGLFDALAASMSLKIDPRALQGLQNIATGNTVAGHDADQQEGAVEASVNSTQADELRLEAINTDIELLEIFLEEAQDLDSAIAQTFNEWRTDLDNHIILKTLQRHMHTIKGGARMAGIRSIGDLTHIAEVIYEAFDEQRLRPTLQWLTIMQMLHDTLSLQIDYAARYQESFFADEFIEQLQKFERSKELPLAVTLVLPALHKDSHEDLEELNADELAEAEQAAKTISFDKIIAQSWPNGLPDADILEVFLEEAEEIIASSNKYLQLFLSNISDVTALQALQRDLHTIKGGARMVTANGIADLAHEMETVYEELAIRRRPATKMVSQLLMACHDWLADAVFILTQKVNPPIPSALVAALKQFSKNPDNLQQVPRESLQEQLNMISAAKKQQKERVVADVNEMPPMTGSFEVQEQSVSHNEVIRISGGLVEHMINLSGESAINRARIDMGISSLTNSIEEMGTTVQRLADQLRRMETELEAQILSQIDDEKLINDEGFDPLEMDQYSSLNQLSKSLSESASDLVDIKITLLEKTRDSESLLLQLARTQAELQDGLMNSRMVPFTRVVPRLERIVRQTAHELNKSVELSIINADDEIDRTILERITSPLEHMLRNAVDHGIENIQARLRAGKSRSGQITLEVLREGSEVVIHLSDDGCGINVDAVRKKAIAQGLIAENDDSLSDLDVMQYIFNAGLTTQKKVTQISGRGVGMNVVISEIRQLGGVVSVNSEEGKGSRFTIRVPLTVAISDALVVRAADRYYAIPLVQIERVIRVNPEKLYDYYESGATSLNIEDENYRIRYLNEILSGNKFNELMVSTNTSLPVIVIKNRTGQKIALQVDQIAGSRIEVVVKPLGRQLSRLSGISAATIMGDGSVMFILDPIALMRNAPVIKDVSQGVVAEREDVKSRITVLVVDDSVTVRKVTSRLLERQGINVAIAKDGIDAIEILQETTPDLILLDIEMPRMDGFEVATQVRHNKRLRDIPIIMITSRTGEKHRERAFKIGVNDYMGKPFQENELLDKIQAQLGQDISLSHNE